MIRHLFYVKNKRRSIRHDNPVCAISSGISLLDCGCHVAAHAIYYNRCRNCYCRITSIFVRWSCGSLRSHAPLYGVVVTLCQLLVALQPLPVEFLNSLGSSCALVHPYRQLALLNDVAQRACGLKLQQLAVGPRQLILQNIRACACL